MADLAVGTGESLPAVREARAPRPIRAEIHRDSNDRDGNVLDKQMKAAYFLTPVIGILIMTSSLRAQSETNENSTTNKSIRSGENKTTATAITIPPGVRLLPDVEYLPNGHARNKLDLYLPSDLSKPVPVILWVHGGGWSAGSKTRCPAIPLTTHGFAIASMNYRFSQHAPFPAQIHDCKSAVRWLRAHARQHGLDGDHIGAWGSSAGGHLVALLGVTGGHAELEGTQGNLDQSSRVQAVVDWFGPTDFLTVGSKPTRTRLLGGDPLEIPDLARLASPLYHVSKGDCPFLIMHGDKDNTVPISQSEVFAAALNKAGVETTFVTVSGGGHGGAKFTDAEQLDRIEKFFTKHLIPTSRP